MPSERSALCKILRPAVPGVLGASAGDQESLRPVGDVGRAGDVLKLSEDHRVDLSFIMNKIGSQMAGRMEF